MFSTRTFNFNNILQAYPASAHSRHSPTMVRLFSALLLVHYLTGVYGLEMRFTEDPIDIPLLAKEKTVLGKTVCPKQDEHSTNLQESDEIAQLAAEKEIAWRSMEEFFHVFGFVGIFRQVVAERDFL